MKLLIHRLSLGLDKWFDPTLCYECNYLFMLGLKLNHVCKKVHRLHLVTTTEYRQFNFTIITPLNVKCQWLSLKHAISTCREIVSVMEFDFAVHDRFVQIVSAMPCHMSLSIDECNSIHLAANKTCKTPSASRCLFITPYPLHWRHNDHDGVSNHQPLGCLLNRLFRRRSKKTSKLRVTGLCAGNSPGPVNSPHKGPVTRKVFPFYDVFMLLIPWLLAGY